MTKDFDFCINREGSFDVTNDVQGWTDDFAVPNGVMPLTIAFANQHPEVVFTSGVPEKQGPWCTPRSLVAADRLLEPQEFRAQPSVFTCRAPDGPVRSLDLPADSLAFTFCGTPIVMVRDRTTGIEIVYSDGRRVRVDGATVEPAVAAHLFSRDGTIDRLVVRVATAG